MRALLHMPFDPASRFVRLVLAEKSLEARFDEVSPLDDPPGLAANNPAMTIPVLIDEAAGGGKPAISPAGAIGEYLEEAYGAPALMPGTAALRAEARRLIAWFHDKYEAEVNTYTLRIRINSGRPGKSAADDEAIRSSADALCWHLDYVSWLLEQRDWLAGGVLSLADLAGAAHLSCSDYLGLVPWRDFPTVKDWYARLKCRPSFRPFLSERVKGLPPPAHYADLDF